jgi:hypothetical protein
VRGWLGSRVAVKTVETPVAAPKTTTLPPPAPAADVASSKITPITPEQEQFFEKKVRPLLAKNCYSCHTRTASGGLRLDSREAVLKGGKDGVVVVPGHPESSLLISALNYKAAIQMPPSGQLKVQEVAVVEQWIKDGAPWPKESPAAPSRQVTEADRAFWAFHTAERPAVPAAKSNWAHNDIDRFIRLEEKHLKPVADADKHTLIRRVTYQSYGPRRRRSKCRPFHDDKSPKAYEQLIERLLASAYGERWGPYVAGCGALRRHRGGGGDYPIAQAAKYRDYVIQSFVDDKPYDRFIANSSPEIYCRAIGRHWQNIIATGYWRYQSLRE